MKAKLACIPLIALLAASTGALAHEGNPEAGPYHRFEHVRSDGPAGSTAGAFDPQQYVEGNSLYWVASHAQATVRGAAGPVRSDPAPTARGRAMGYYDLGDNTP